MPLATVTDPVGVGLPLVGLTLTVTVSDCAVVMLLGEGVAVTVGVVVTGAVTVTGVLPVDDA